MKSAITLSVHELGITVYWRGKLLTTYPNWQELLKSIWISQSERVFVFALPPRFRF